MTDHHPSDPREIISIDELAKSWRCSARKLKEKSRQMGIGRQPGKQRILTLEEARKLYDALPSHQRG